MHAVQSTIYRRGHSPLPWSQGMLFDKLIFKVNTFSQSANWEYYHIAENFRGVNFHKLPKLSNFEGKIFVGGHPVPYSIYVTQISWVKFSWHCSNLQKPRKFPPRKFPAIRYVTNGSSQGKSDRSREGIIL